MKAVKRRNFVMLAILFCVSSSGCNGCNEKNTTGGTGDAVAPIPMNVHMTYSGASKSKNMRVTVQSSTGPLSSTGPTNTASCDNNHNQDAKVLVDFGTKTAKQTTVTVTAKSDLGVTLGTATLNLPVLSDIYVDGLVSTAKITVKP